jgi:RNA polymerase primary sigma factor
LEELRHRFKREPTTSEIAKRMRLHVEKVREIAQTLLTQPTSLEMPIGEEDAGELLELVEDESAAPPDKEISEILQHEHIEELLNMLDPKGRAGLTDKKVIVLRFGLEGNKALTLQEIAKKFEVTKERIRQREERAIKKLKEFITEERKKEESTQEAGQ